MWLFLKLFIQFVYYSNKVLSYNIIQQEGIEKEGEIGEGNEIKDIYISSTTTDDDHHTSPIEDNYNSTTDDHHSSSEDHGCEHEMLGTHLDHIVVYPISIEAAEGGFSSGLALGGLNLMVAYVIVAAFAVLLDFLFEYVEVNFKGSHQIIIQRIYRTIMVLGCSAVSMKIFIATGIHPGEEWVLAYEFADMTSFMTALFFACQGFIIMVISISDANAWYRAASIRVEELLIDAEVVQARQPRLWRWVMLPFCRTRDQVEFRIFRLIFSSVYHISGNPQVFNYAELLKRTHECNLLSLIDFDFWKWGIIVFIIGIVSIKSQFGYSRTCSTESCVALDELLFFTSGGFLLLILALLLALAGRWSEIKLLKRYGIHEPVDYEIYLRKEEDILEKMSAHVLSKKALMTLISDLKHEAAVKQFKKQHKLLAESTSIDQMNESHDLASKPSKKTTQSFSQQIFHTLSKKDKTVDFEEKAHEQTELQMNHGHNSNHHLPFHIDDAVHQTMKKMFGPAWTPAAPIHPGGRASASAAVNKWQHHVNHNTNLQQQSSQGQVPHSPSDPNFHTQPSNKISIFEVVSDDLAQRQFRNNLLKSSEWHELPPQLKPSPVNRQQSDTFKRQYGRQGSMEAIKTINNTVLLEERMKNVDDTGRFKNIPKDPENDKAKRQEAAREQILIDLVKKKLQHAYANERGHGGHGSGNNRGHKTLFREIFLFGNPEYYAIFINWVMTGNALYLAWWLTTFTFAATKIGSIGSAVLWFLLPLVPAILTFPLLAMIIKSSTNLKAITEIDLEIVSEVMEKTEEISKYVHLLRKCLLHRLRLVGMENERKAVSDLFEEVEDSQIGHLSIEDFRRMLVRLQMFLDKPVWTGMFAWIDLNHDGFISLEVKKNLNS